MFHQDRLYLSHRMSTTELSPCQAQFSWEHHVSFWKVEKKSFARKT
ncbi:hypothetical protein M3J09_010502 [Ascochyta lentis]